MSESRPVSLKLFFLMVVLWMPISYFFWFAWAGVFVAPVGWLVEPLLGLALGNDLRDVVQVSHMLQIEIYFTPPEGTRLDLNPMIFGYGLPLLSGLIIATPNRIGWRIVQILIAWGVVALVQTWGIFWETHHQLQTYTGAEGLAVVRATGFSPELIAFGYQFGYLILPAVVPVVIWMLLNRRFVEDLVMTRTAPKEPADPDDGQLDRPE